MQHYHPVSLSPTLSFWYSRIDAWLKCPWRDISAHCQWYGKAGRGGQNTRPTKPHDPGIDGSYKSHPGRADNWAEIHTFSHGLCWSSSRHCPFPLTVLWIPAQATCSMPLYKLTSNITYKPFPWQGETCPLMVVQLNDISCPNYV